MTWRLPRGRALAVAGAAVLVIAAGCTVLTVDAGSPSPARSSQPGSAQAAGTGGQGGNGQGGNGSQGGGSRGQRPPGAPAGTPYAGVPADHVAALPAAALPGAAGGGGAGGGRGRVVTLVVLSGAPSLSVRVARLGGELLEAATAPGYGARPVAEVNGAATPARSAPVIGLSLDPAGSEAGAPLAGGAQLSVTLSADVTWQLDFGGGTSDTTADLAGGHVAGVDFGQGTSRARLTLPPPEGTTLVRLDGGVSQLSVAVPAGVPARVTAGAGAGQVLLGGRAYAGVAGGTVLAQPGWAGAASRVDVQASSGAWRISVAER